MSLNITANLTTLISRGMSGIKSLRLFFHPSRISQKPGLGCNLLTQMQHLGMSFPTIMILSADYEEQCISFPAYAYKS